ncbi:MAG: phosphatase PAP2 family protein [Deltaproteobacteria bacterium]|nr:phosphatase PAP2 family protein [Deltaproteobacteria bacterium]
MFAELLAWDRAAFLQLNAPRGEAWDLLFGYGTYLGDGLVLAVILFIVTKLFDGRRFPKNFLLIGIAMLFAGALNGIVKNAFDRPRPLNEPAFAPVKAERVETALGPWLTRHEYRAAPGGEGGLRVLGKRYGRRSFPSGHTAAAFAFAAGMIYAYRFAWTWLVLLPAAFVGLSRIVCGVHFPIDVFGGALIGASVSAGFLRAFEMFHGLGGKIHPRAPHRDDGPPRVMMVVGEASADVYGARILAAMRAKEPGVSAFGVGGEQLENAGLERVADAHDLSIVGFTAVLTSLGAIVRIYRRLMRLFETRRPDLLVCIDLPDFNLMLAQQARFRGVPVL